MTIRSPKGTDYSTPRIDSINIEENGIDLEFDSSLFTSSVGDRMAAVRSTGNSICYLTGEMEALQDIDAGTSVATLPNICESLSTSNYVANLGNQDRWIIRDVNSGGNAQLRGVGFNGVNTYIIVGGMSASVRSSFDTITWFPITMPNSDFRQHVHYEPSLDIYSIVGAAGQTFVSSDATNWTLNASGAASTLNWVTFGIGLFVTVGNLDGGNPAIYASPDAAVWTVRANTLTESLQSVSFGNALFVAVGDNGTIATSADAITWTAQTSGVPDDLFGVKFLNNQFIACGDNTTVLTSPDGIVWTQETVTGLPTNLNLMSLDYSGSEYVFVGASSTIIQSPDLVSWFDEPNPFTGQGLLFRDVLYDGSEFILCGAGDSCLVSSFDSSVLPSIIRISGNDIVTEADIAVGNKINFDGITYVAKVNYGND